MYSWIRILKEKQIGQPIDLALFIEQVENAESILDEVNARLVVVEVDEGPFDLLFNILFLLQLEDMLKRETESKTRVQFSHRDTSDRADRPNGYRLTYVEIAQSHQAKLLL